MKLPDFTKIVALSTAVSSAGLFADTYKPEVKRDGQTITFRIHNLTVENTDSFSVKKSKGAYESGDWSVNNNIYGIMIGTGVAFDFGTFHASFDDKNDRLFLSNGSFDDTLLLEKTDCSFTIASATELKIHTLIVKEIQTFKNEGSTEAFIATFQDCSTVENRGKFHSRNLFLYNTNRYGFVERRL